jgi:tellurite methyltransferase
MRGQATWIDEMQGPCYACLMTQIDAEYWDGRYQSGGGPQSGRALGRLDEFSDHVDDLMARLVEDRLVEDQCAGRSQALDVACGAGGTLAWLAERGWHATGVDASAEALRLASVTISNAGLAAHCTMIQADLDSWRPLPCRYDLVTCFYFLDRTLMPALRDAVRPGGLLILETFNRHWLTHRPQSKPGFLLGEGELLAMVTGWGWQVMMDHSLGAEAERPTDSIVARRPGLP